MEYLKGQNSKARSAVDFRGLNSFLKVVDYPFPVGEQMIDVIASRTRFFSKIDLSKAYHQMKIIDDVGCLTIRTNVFC